jgi:WD40 repeat protein
MYSTNATVSPNGELFAISCPPNRFDIYRSNMDQPIFELVDDAEPVSSTISLPVLFIHEGLALLSGSSNGEAKMWDATTGYLHHSLPVGGIRLIAHIPGAPSFMLLS